MKDLFFLLITLVVSAVAYFSSMNLYTPILVFVMYLMYYFIFGRKRLVRKEQLTRRIHVCYHFINAFIISMSVKESMEDAYQSGIRYEDKEIKEIAGGLENLKVSDRISYLREFFNLAVFKMFMNVLNLYQDQGGNILSMSEELISESTRIEKSLSESNAESNKHLVQFLLLWIMSSSVLLFIRFSISSFYETMIKSPIFAGFLLVFFILILFSIHLFIVRYSSIVVKEDRFHEQD